MARGGTSPKYHWPGLIAEEKERKEKLEIEKKRSRIEYVTPLFLVIRSVIVYLCFLFKSNLLSNSFCGSCISFISIILTWI